ncbi:MAG: HAD-IA family hydrolase [Planctomycetota bacterium]
MLRALLLDFGGTLAREVPSRGELYARSARARGVAIDGDAMGRLMGEVHGELPRTVAGRPRYSDPWFERFIDRVFRGRLGLPLEVISEVTRELFERFSDARSFEVLPGARELLLDARAHGLRTAVVSNWSEHLAELLAALGLLELLDVVISSAVLGAEKPDAASFEAALRPLDVAPHAALFVGNDVANDVIGAIQAGIEAVLVDPSGARAVPSGSLRVASLSQLRPLVLSRARR